ncbi:hypothetical protein IFM89_002702 [Coptis chinensis]|uniref:Beta-glucosidase n=1 Tax=Coptis chinensis TaxID=261450 RepID=A0A835M9K1_9MAGN|nr:hypothetical protein IFM89_002702 [Coptis chinensis]
MLSTMKLVDYSTIRTLIPQPKMRVSIIATLCPESHMPSTVKPIDYATVRTLIPLPKRRVSLATERPGSQLFPTMSPRNTLKSHIDTGGVRAQLSFARESRKISKLFPPISELKSTPEGEDPARLKANGIIVGWGQQRLLDYVKLNYKNPAAIIHENGLPMTSDDSSNPTTRNDTVRIKLLQIYIKNLHPSIRNGSNLGGYFIWSFLDVFQVTGGYTSHFGLYGVDFRDKKRRRYPRQSVEWYSILK